ncbi:Aconitate hydratase 1 [Serratia marcescens]|uniref:Aconitate hydratase 1 n=1 Tax=Serratia marcescens TaxID=615 RepID=A0A379ZGP0_SERMA|nr:Aconitate hydratase 1 [Serratia marcescens]
MKIDLTKEPLGEGNDGQPVYLKDIWPSSQDIAQAVEEVRTEMFHKEYGEVFDGDANWQAIQVTGSATYQWQEDSTYIRHPPFFSTMQVKPDPVQDIKDARILAILADSVTTDHISPAGNIKRDSRRGVT